MRLLIINFFPIIALKCFSYLLSFFEALCLVEALNIINAVIQLIF